MPDFVTDARSFLRELRQNNDRDWFQAHKSRYDTALRDPALELLDRLAPRIAELLPGTVATKLFRPHRDVRFSKDKTPYTTHLHMLWTTDTGGRQPVGWFFGINPEQVRMGGGAMGFEKGVLDDWRARVAEDGAAVEATIREVEARGFTRSEPALKRVPAPYEQDHPQGDLLKRKGMTLWRDLEPGDDLDDSLMAAFRDLAPLQRLLAGIV